MSIRFNDFVPPIFYKHISKARKLFKQAMGHRIPRGHFEYVPTDIQASWVLDVGANVGDVAIHALKTYPDCKVICFEPVSETYKILKHKLHRYGDRVILFQQGLSDVSGRCEINLTTYHGANSILPQSKFHKFFNPHVREVGKETISVVRLDDIAATFPTTHIDIMKIDVEGYELNVLRGGAEYIPSHVDTIIIEASLQRDVSWESQSIVELFTLLQEMGFRLINVMGIYNSKGGEAISSMMVTQMDCVFRHISKLQKTADEKRGIPADFDDAATISVVVV